MERLNKESPLSNRGYSTPQDNLKAPRHRWYFYKEGFSNNLVNHAIEESGISRGDLIFDPFLGSGTVSLCSSQKNFDSIGIEVNPFASFLSQTKHINAAPSYLRRKIRDDLSKVLSAIDKGKKSPFLTFSTFSEYSAKEKWLFNSDVLNGFEGGYQALKLICPQYRPLYKLALLNAAMDNCNAKKDGKCLRYRSNWLSLKCSRQTFLQSFNSHFENTIEDLSSNHLHCLPKLYQHDSRKYLQENQVSFKLCITSPPYLNSFDYTDVYRPELFLGRFIKSQSRLKELRSRTLCSHINVTASSLQFETKSLLYNKLIKDVGQYSKQFWDRRLIQMIHSYFHEMNDVLTNLHAMAAKQSQLWIVVANSAYFNQEIPTDLILADLGARIGWKLKEIVVLRDVFKRGSKYSPDINSLRESAIVFRKP